MIAQVRKAIAAAVAAAGAVLTAALTKGTIGQADIALALGSAIVAGVLVFFVPNALPPPVLVKPGPPAAPTAP